MNPQENMSEKQKKAYMEIQQLQQQIQQMQEHIEEIDEKLQEAQELKQDMEDVKNLEEGDEVLFPIASGIFAEGKITNVDKLKVNVGSETVVDKTIDETQDLVEEQVVELKRAKQQTETEYQSMVQRAQKLSQEIR